MSRVIDRIYAQPIVRGTRDNHPFSISSNTYRIVVCNGV